MTLHRHLQISSLQEKSCAKAGMYRRAFLKAVSLGNTTAAVRFLERATRLDMVALACVRRFAV